MAREISAGGVVLRRISGIWHIAAIVPRRDPEADPPTRKGKQQPDLLALPKGLVDPPEKPEQTAVREVREETGVTAAVVTKLADIKYSYIRSWGDRQRVFKIVSFYLLRYESGQINDLSPDMRLEVKEALWVPLEEVPQKLTYRSEREVVQRAKEYVDTHPECQEGA